MTAVKDHVVKCDEGFYDMQRYPERVEHGGTIKVTQAQFKQMKNSDPSIRLIRIEVPLDILKRIVTTARKEKAELSVSPDGNLDVISGSIFPPEVDSPVADWQPVGWYKGQLNKDGGMNNV